MTDGSFQVPAPRFLRRSNAAKYIRDRWGLPCAARTLAKIACVSSDGPEMHYAGRVPLYTTESLDKWASKRIGPARRSTSDHEALALDAGTTSNTGRRKGGATADANDRTAVASAPARVRSKADEPEA
jgi:hypothetical protein